MSEKISLDSSENTAIFIDSNRNMDNVFFMIL